MTRSSHSEYYSGKRYVEIDENHNWTVLPESPPDYLRLYRLTCDPGRVIMATSPYYFTHCPNCGDVLNTDMKEFQLNDEE